MARRRVAGVVRRIHTLRREGENMQTFAERLGVSFVMMKQLYAGTRNPGVKTLTNICSATGADFNWLMTGKGVKYAGTELPPELPSAKPSVRDMKDEADVRLPAEKAKALRALIKDAAKDSKLYAELINFHEFYLFKARKAKRAAVKK